MKKKILLIAFFLSACTPHSEANNLEHKRTRENQEIIDKENAQTLAHRIENSKKRNSERAQEEKIQFDCIEEIERAREKRKNKFKDLPPYRKSDLSWEKNRPQDVFEKVSNHADSGRVLRNLEKADWHEKNPHKIPRN